MATSCIITHMLRALLVFGAMAPALAQVHYHPDGHPWRQRVEQGPDSECPGWFYNLGVTGIRVQLTEDAPCALLVGCVLKRSVAEGRVLIGDRIIGASGARFETPHRNGYGAEVFGPHGPIADFASALDRALGSDGRELVLRLERGGEELDVTLSLTACHGAYAAGFPLDCDVQVAVRARLETHILEAQREDGSWGSPVEDTFAPLALLSSDTEAARAAVEANARWHARTTSPRDTRALVNWHYTAAAIVLSEFQLATGAGWVQEELGEINRFLHDSQYMDRSQVSPSVKQSHPQSWPESALQQHGGFGHKQGFEGYGPIAMITAQAAIGYELMRRVGVEVDVQRVEAAHAFLDRGTGRNGYVWYADSVAAHDGWADHGRTGAAAVAAALGGKGTRKSALERAAVMGAHPESFPDTHGSPLMGMGFAAAGALVDEAAYLALLRANRWWFVLAECPDGSFYYQPNRDNAGYDSGARARASATVAFILSLNERHLVLAGRK